VMENARIHIPLLEGEYNPPWKIRSLAQILFLDVVTTVTPGPLYALREEILPKYREAFQLEKRRGRSDVEVSSLSSAAVVDRLYQRALKSLKLPPEVQSAMKAHRLLYDAGEALIAWSEAFNLRGKRCGADLTDHADRPGATLQHRGWPIVAALQTILFWHFHPVGWIWERRDPPRWCPPVFTLHEPPLDPEALPPVELFVTVQAPDGKESRKIGVPGWCVGLETEKQFRQRVGEAFGRWMDNYIAGRRESARAAGLEETPSKQKLPLHFSWAAKYQIDKISPSKLAREYRVATDTVKAGIQGALELLNLERRPPQRGGIKAVR